MRGRLAESRTVGGIGMLRGASTPGAGGMRETKLTLLGLDAPGESSRGAPTRRCGT